MEQNKSDDGSFLDAVVDTIVKMCKASSILPVVRQNSILKTGKRLRDKMDRIGTVFENDSTTIFQQQFRAELTTFKDEVKSMLLPTS